MPAPFIRVKQSTSTPGTGDVVLNAASPALRSFKDMLGLGAFRTRYQIQKDGVREFGYGPIDTTVAPAGQLSRSTVVDSSNGGAPVNLTGTADIFFPELPGDRQFKTISTTTTLALEDIGNVIRCTPSADMTAGLPAVATVPGGANLLSMGFVIFNDGSNNSIVWIDPNGSETLDGVASPFPLFVGESIYVFGLGTFWKSINRPRGERLVGRYSASAVASVDITLPHYVNAARSWYRLAYRQVRGSVDGASLLLLMSPDGGTNWRTSYSQSFKFGTGGATPGNAPGTALGALNLSTDIDTTGGSHHAHGEISISPGAAGARRASIEGRAFNYGNGGWGTYAGPQKSDFGGHSDVAEDINMIRLKMDSGNVGLGDFDLFAVFD